jgi:flagella synthesis protein FlgN
MTSITAMLKHEADLVTRFRDTLLCEQEILRSGKTDGLAEINADKLSLAESLNVANAERSRNLLSIDGTYVDMQDWFSNHPMERESASLWKKLLELAREAREINEANGSLINSLHQKTSDALTILTLGQGELSIYSCNGQASLSTSSRIVDSA